MAKPGPDPKGERRSCTVRVPVHHLDIYEHRARESGLSRNDYLVLALARAHQLEEPEYLNRDRRQGELLSMADIEVTPDEDNPQTLAIGA